MSSRSPPPRKRRRGSEISSSESGDEIREVAIRGEVIRLGQLLKLAGLAGSGGEAKTLLVEGAVMVNDVVEDRRGRQLGRGDVVRVGAERIRVV